MGFEPDSPALDCRAGHAAMIARRTTLLRSPADLPPPVILLGMHRSGTSILARMLRACGLFLGRNLDNHYEPGYFRRVNDALLNRAGSSWSQPEEYRGRRGDPDFHRESVEFVRRSVDRDFAGRFFTLAQRIPLLGDPLPHWGWKEPRTCLSMGVWNELFPEARLIHIVRHPLDVALSLRRREEERQALGKKPLPWNADLAHGLALWEAYVSDLLELRTCHERYLELRYEDLVDAPRQRLVEVARFAGLPDDAARLDTAAGLAEGDRARRYEDSRWAEWRERAAALPSARELKYE
jgi:hypothetical protein